jgi:hypothetical protein
MSDLTTIDPDKSAAVRAKLDKYRQTEERERCEESLSEFVRCAWPYLDSSEYQQSWALDALSDHLEAVTLGHIKRLLINISPRCGKTSVVSILYPMWTWARSEKSFWSGPQVRFLCASYGHSLSLDSSNKARRIIMSPWYQKHWGERFKLRADQSTKAQFDNTGGGSYIATSVGGSLLGRGADIALADDLNNTQEVESEAERLTVANFWSEFHSTRLNNPQLSAVINVQQRLAENDVSGLILKAHAEGSENWTHLCIPMSYDPNRSYHTIKLPQYDDDEVWDDPRTEEG